MFEKIVSSELEIGLIRYEVKANRKYMVC